MAQRTTLQVGCVHFAGQPAAGQPLGKRGLAHADSPSRRRLRLVGVDKFDEVLPGLLPACRR